MEGSFRGLAVPPGTPDSIVQKLYEACSKTNKDPVFLEKMGNMGMTPLDMNPKESAEFIAKKVEDYKALLKEISK